MINYYDLFLLRKWILLIDMLVYCPNLGFEAWRTFFSSFLSFGWIFDFYVPFNSGKNLKLRIFYKLVYFMEIMLNPRNFCRVLIYEGFG
jgi:hypothetical protein